MTSTDSTETGSVLYGWEQRVIARAKRLIAAGNQTQVLEAIAETTNIEELRASDAYAAGFGALTADARELIAIIDRLRTALTDERAKVAQVTAHLDDARNALYSHYSK